MTESAFTFRASWPILDDRYTATQLRVEACAEVDQLAYEAHARITGPITWTVLDDRLYAHAPAVPVVPVSADTGRAAWGSVRRQLDRIEHLKGLGFTDREIAAQLGCQPDSVKHARHRSRSAA